MKYSLLAAAFATVILVGCEGKKSLDGHPMDKPPPSAFAPREAEPDMQEAGAGLADNTAATADSKTGAEVITDAAKSAADATDKATQNVVDATKSTAADAANTAKSAADATEKATQNVIDAAKSTATDASKEVDGAARRAIDAIKGSK
jgi:hypothetical protein